MPDPVDAVLFDLDDTLCAYRRSTAELLALSFDRVGVDPLFPVEDYYATYAEFVADSDGMDDLRERCFATLADRADRDPDLGRELAAVYSEERDHAAVDPLPGSPGVVEQLAAEYRIGLITNGAPGAQRKKMAALGLGDAFETVVFAGYDVPAKPAPDPFEVALSDLGVPPERAVHVGDSVRSDVAGARAAGVRSVLVPDGNDEEDGPDPDYRVETPADLVPPPWREA